MLDRADPVVELKLDLLARGLEGVGSAVVFGDIWRVDGAYTLECAKSCERVLLIDSLETARWQESRLAVPHVDYRKGDFSDPIFMAGVRRGFELGVAFDVLLHQPPLLDTLSRMLDLVEWRLCVVQPVLAEQASPGALLYLPGNEAARELHPLEVDASDHRLFDAEAVNHSHWIWAMSASFLHAAMRGEGFEPAFETVLGELPNPRWRWWGAVYERRRPRPATHWRALEPPPGLHQEAW